MNGRRLRPIRFAHSGFQSTPPADDDNAPDNYELGFYDEPSAEAPAETPAEAPAAPFDVPAAPVNEGLDILGGMATAEVPTAEEPTRDLRPPWQQSRQQPPDTPPDGMIIQVTSGPSGATWNQPLTSAPQPVGGGEERKRGSFWMAMSGLLRGPAADDDGQPRITVRDLPPDVQLRFWRIRLLIMLVVGLVFGIISNWYVGLTLAILAGIIDSAYRSRNAPYYDNGATFPGARKRTSRQLRRMRRAGYLALDARPIPNSREVIDHLVVGPTGVYAIDSERWDRRLPVRAINGKRLYLGPESQKERLEHALWEAGQASELLTAALGTKVDVRAALAIYGPRIPWDIATIRNVDVFTGPALRRYLKRRNKAREGRRLSPQEVRTYYAAAARVLPDSASAQTATPVG